MFLSLYYSTIKWFIVSATSYKTVTPTRKTLIKYIAQVMMKHKHKQRRVDQYDR